MKKQIENSLKSIFDNATVGIYRTTPDGRILMVNPFLVKLLGYESEEELKKRDLNKKEYYEPGYEREKFIKEIEEKGYFVGESAWKRKDGSTIWVRESAVAIKDEEGNTLYYDGVVEDITELKKKEEQLIKARDDWEAIFNSITDPVIVLAKDHTILDANPATLKALGKSREEVIGKKCFEFFHEDKKIAKGCPMEKLLRSKKPETETMEMEALGGIYIVSVSPVFEKGEITRVVHHAKDVTELKRMIRELEDSEARFRGIFESAVDAIFLMKGDRFIHCNPATLEIFGCEEKDIIGATPYKFSPPKQPDGSNSKKKALELIKKAMEGKPQRFEWKHSRLDGSTFDAEVILNRVKLGGEYYIMAIVRDITARKKAEKALRESEKFLRDVLESIQDGISVLDTDLNIRMVNSTMEKWYAENMPLVGKKCYEAYHNRKTPCEKCPTLRCIKSGKMEKETISDAFKNYIELYSYPMKDENGNVVGVVEFVRDVSLQKKAEKALRESEKRFRSMFENSLNAIAIHKVVTDRKGKPVDYVFTAVNNSFEKETGLKAEDVVGRRITEVIPDVDTKLIEEYGKIALEGGSSRFEIFSKPLGKYLEISVFSLSKGELVTIFRDISGRVKYVNTLKFLADSVAQLNEIDSLEALYDFIAKSIKSIAGDAIVVVSSYKPKSKTIVIQSVKGLGNNISTILKLLGKNVVGMEFPVHEDKYAQYGEKLVKLSDGIYRLSSGKISKRVAEIIQKLLNIGDIYSMDITRGGELFGNITIIMRKEKKLENKDLIETFIKEAGIAYQRLLILQQLRESEKRYRQLYENAGVPIFTYDENLIVTNVNEIACIMAGVKKKDVVGKNMLDINILHPADMKKALDAMEKLFSGKEDVAIEKLRLRRADGTYGIFEIYATIRKFAGRKEIINVCHDVTEKERLLKELAESENRFRSLVENAHDAIYIISSKGFEYVNPAFEKLTGYSREELLSEDFSFWTLIHPDDIEKIKERQRAREKKKKINSRYEFRIITKSGETRVVEVATVDVGRESYRVIGILRDVTEKIKAQEEINKLSNLHYLVGMGINRNDTVEGLCRDLLAGIKDVLDVDYGSIFLYDKDKKSLIPVAHIGYPKEMMRKIVKEYPVEKDQPWVAVKVFLEAKEKYIKNIQRYKPLAFNRDLYKKYGIKELYTVPLIVKEEMYGVLQVASRENNPITDDKRKLLRAISEEIAAGIAKIEAEERMREMLERERRFKLDTSHYFFNPIAIAKGYLQLALEDDDGKEKILKAIEAIERVEKVVKNITTKGEIRE